ncbi:Shikimate kinase I [hydrothermal vent metagenome]|uniref:shikimate kinase n=1 Tax=hydrothermal vent metagenome TaxID=652676 RepID=A0A3B0X639_9ZZZZ
MGNKPNIFLIGPMGAGKTTMGRQIARRLKMDFEDSDHIIEAQTGADISLIFEKEGEVGFRKREIAAIDTLTQRSNLVLATGGGAVLTKENRQHLKNRGIVIYLHSNIKHLLERVGHDTNRPLLQGTDPATKFREIMKIRDPLYRETADIVINTGQQSIRYVINVMLGRIKSFQKKSQAKNDFTKR